MDQNQLDWVLDSGRFVNDKTCVVDETIFGKAGNTINNNKFSNRVDLETKLLGIGNLESKCKQPSEIQYEPQNNDTCNFFNFEADGANNNQLTDKQCS
tara:strand:- start:263 stop:556 length:294 start_codon:yes stop_codon:yes gene_type:complete